MPCDILVFIYLQREPLTFRGTGVLIYLPIHSEAGGGEAERQRRRVLTQMERWRVEGGGGAWIFLPL